MKVIVAGSRNFFAYNRVVEIIEASEFEITQVVSGCAEGVDNLGELWAKNHNVGIRFFATKWSTCRGNGGHERNGKMVVVADALIAVYNSTTSNGTADLIEQAKEQGLAYYIYDLADGTVDNGSIDVGRNKKER
jgi:hypothetical protein